MSKKISQEDLTNIIQPGSRIFIGTGCSEPTILTQQMVAHKHHFTDCEILHFLTLSENKFFDGQAPSPFRHQALFVGKSIRQAVNEGKADYIPISLSDIPKLVKSGRLRIDVALLQVSPPAKFGFCSLGINVDINRTVFECAKTVIAQINPLMPRASGDSFVRFADIDYYVEHEAPLLEFSYPETASAPVFTAGVGGQLDFTRGAALSEGGKPIICLPSLTHDGQKSRLSALSIPV
jgi:acyl-CoA hydrolase